MKASENVFPQVILDGVTSDPAAPSNDNWKLYAKPDGVYARSSNAIVGPLSAGGAAAVATDTIWDAAGDLAVGTGANTAARLAIGATNGMALRRVSGAVAWDLPPGHEFDYVQVTSAVSVVATAEASATTLVTGNGIAYDGLTRICIEFFAPFAALQATSGNNLICYLYDGASSIGLIWQATNNASVTLRMGAAHAKVFLTPSAATKTYSIRATTTAGTGSIGGGAGGSAGAYWPMYIRQTKA